MLQRLKPYTSWIILGVIIVVFAILLIINETKILRNDKTHTFEEALAKQTSGNITNTIAKEGAFVEASKDEIEAAMTIHRHDEDLKYMDISEPVPMAVSEVNSLLKGKGKLSGQGEAFLKAQEKYDVNVLYLISHAMVETGHGDSALSQGMKYKGKRYYNFFGIGAFDEAALKNGSSYARQAEWTTPEKAINGGAKFVRQTYFENGQISLYQMRWNPESPGTHQYASDIRWADEIAAQMAKHYKTFGIKQDDVRRDYYKHK